MIHILYLAAGQSRRYGSNKLLDDWNGKPLYRWGLDTIREAIRERDDCTLTVVTCWQEIQSALEEEEIRTADCPDSHLGVSYTIRAGIRSLGSLLEEDYLCFAVADQPNLTPETIDRLLDTAKTHPLTACLASGEFSGNPVLFSEVLAEELCALEGDCGGKAVMRRHPENHLDVPCDPAELEDIDVKAK
ncbi:MAG: nucleotidyltransferase family protein [Clostridia bacterium]|nr:nucleotidyltransferase family protein [Clostridia bacterium]